MILHSRTLALVLLSLAACSSDVERFDSTGLPDAGHVAPERSTEWVEVFRTHPETPREVQFGRHIAIADGDIYATSYSRQTTDWRLARYSKRDGSWSFTKVLRGEDLQADSATPGAIHALDDRVWLGVPGAGAGGEVWELSRDLQLVQRIPSPVPRAEFGTSIVADSEWLLIGAAGQDAGRGAVHVFRRMGANLVPAGILTPPPSAGFPRLGHALAKDGLHLYVGAPGRCAAGRCGPGAVYVYALDASGIWQDDAVWQSPEAGLSQFGHDLAARGEQRVVVSTAFSKECGDDQPDCLTDTGQAYMASGDASAPTWSGPLRPETPEKKAEHFGKAVDAHGPHLVFGAPGDQSSASNVQGGSRSNAGVIFIMTDGEPYRRLRPLVWTESDRTGEGLAVFEDVLAVGSPNKITPDLTDRSGVITIFELQNTLPEN